MNQADSEKINMVLLQSGFLRAKSGEEAELVICNTCSVRQKGEDRVFGMIRDFKKNNPKVKVGITGCMVRKTGVSKEHLKEHLERTPTRKIEFLSD